MTSRPTPPPDVPSVDEDAGRARTRSLERRAVLVGLGVSVLVHVALVLLYPGLMDQVPHLRTATSPDAEVLPLQGIEIVTVREIEDDPEVPEQERPPEVVIDLPEPVPTDEPEAFPFPVPPTAPVAGQGAEAQDRDPDARTAAERLRPRMGDPRLWAPLDRDVTDLTDEERAEIYLRGMIRDWNDSVAVAVALAGDATDWTYTDDEGRRWGLSPGRLHLGDFSIPLPLSFQLPPGRRDEAALRNWELRDIMRGTASAAVRESWAQRAREIRERLEQERARARSEPPPGGGN
jgi:hypothetical protein